MVNNVAWRVMTVLAVALPALSANPPQEMAASQTSYTSEDGSFSFAYPGDFQVCTAGKMQPCTLRSYIPPCEEDAVICVVYPAQKTAGTNFGSAAFQVRIIDIFGKTATPAGCVKPYEDDAEGAAFRPGYLRPAKHPGETIGGVRFAHGESGGAAAGHTGSVDAYRTYHHGHCYELSLTESQSSAANYDPPIKTVTPAAQEEMDQIFARLLHSFRFQD